MHDPATLTCARPSLNAVHYKRRRFGGRKRTGGPNFVCGRGREGRRERPLTFSATRENFWRSTDNRSEKPRPAPRRHANNPVVPWPCNPGEKVRRRAGWDFPVRRAKVTAHCTLPNRQRACQPRTRSRESRRGPQNRGGRSINPVQRVFDDNIRNRSGPNHPKSGKAFQTLGAVRCRRLDEARMDGAPAKRETGRPFAAAPQVAPALLSRGPMCRRAG